MPALRLILPLFLLVSVVRGQGLDHSAESILKSLIYSTVEDPTRDVRLCDSLIKHFNSQTQPCKAIQATAKLAVIRSYTGDFISAQEALVVADRDYHQQQCDEFTNLVLQWARSYIWNRMGELGRADSITLAAIQSIDPDEPDKRMLMKLYLNLQFINWPLPDIKHLLDSAYQLAVANQLPFYQTRLLINLGAQYAYRDSLETARKYFLQALTQARALKDDPSQMTLYNNLAGLSDDNRETMRYIDSAMVYAKKLQNLDMLQALYQNKAFVLSWENQYQSAYDTLWYAFYLSDSLLTTEKYKAIADMREKYETEKKINEIQSLKLTNLDTELQSLKYKRTKNRFLYGGLAILGLAILLGYGLVTIRKSRAIIKTEKERSESLLLNILPEEIAEELKSKGKADPRHYDQVSILFSDFKNFTELSERLSPAELVEELNACFQAFDRIMGKYGLEKIKTIGDAYMAAGGLPIPSDQAVHQTILAALEMQKFMLERKSNQPTSGSVAFDMRVGIHTGPVVAGIVGEKKFQYDIWGDAVNMASRMESNGLIGQVNISQQTYFLVRDNPQFVFTPREAIDIKGKGLQHMWLVRLA